MKVLENWCTFNLNVPLSFAFGNIEDLGKTKLTVPLGPVSKCLLFISGLWDYVMHSLCLPRSQV